MNRTTFALLLLITTGASAAVPNTYSNRFLELWKKLHDPANGYFSQEGIPYHSAETLIVEAPDYGHLTTSETLSYNVWLAAVHGRITGDWQPFNQAWDIIDRYGVPTEADQPGIARYGPGKPSSYAGEWEVPQKYPSPLEMNVPVGNDPLHDQLVKAYGPRRVYGMHWLIDTDNWYGYGQRGDGKSRPSFINTFQRGPEESVWETVPHPSYEVFKFGGRNGFLDLFIKDNNYTRQWRYTNAPDADARAVQATYWAWRWAQDSNGKNATHDINPSVERAVKMGDFLRYAMFDKYFKRPGCANRNEQGASGYDSAHYLLSWYYAWGGAADGAWSWKMGSSHVHFGYQNPMAAWVLSSVPEFAPKSANGARDWRESLARQVEFYTWLQSAEGAIAGGATNSWNGRYDRPPESTATFHGMSYLEHPVYLDPGSNQWFGMQAWSMQRVAELYYLSGDQQAEALLDKWVGWVKSVTKLNADGTYAIPATLKWTGQPDNWNGRRTENRNLHVAVEEWNEDTGVASSLANTLIYYSAGKKRQGVTDDASRALAKELLDRMWEKCRDDKGLSVNEPRKDYNRFFEQEVYVPAGWAGKMPNGDSIKHGVKFIDIRSKYRADPDFAKVEQAYREQKAPVFRYHRFWAQAEAAVANALYGEMFASEK